MKFFAKLFSRKTDQPSLEDPRSSVNGLPLPPLLLDLIDRGAWNTPDDPTMRAAIPALKQPVDFLKSVEEMAIESQGTLADHMNTATIFKEYRGKRDGQKELPWMDVDLSVIIAINRDPDTDLAIALDYRVTLDAPKVIFSDWWTQLGHCNWTKAFDSFEAFAAATLPAPR